MSDVKSAWASAKTFPKVGDGVYEAVLHNLEFKKTKTTDKDMFCWDFILPNGTHYFHNRVLHNENSLSFAKQDFENLDILTDDFDVVLNCMQTLVGSKIEIEIKTNGAYQNCSVLSMIEPFDFHGY